MDTSTRLSETIVCAACGAQAAREGNDWPTKTGYYHNDADKQIRICTECTKLGHSIQGNQLILNPLPRPTIAAPGTGIGECQQDPPNVMVSHLGTNPLRSKYDRKKL